MADKQPDIDLTTLREVERILATTEFASIDDLARKGGLAPLSSALQAGAAPSGAPAGNSEGLAPLPRRR